MSTQRLGANPGYTLQTVVSGVGAATNSHNVELTYDCATTIVVDNTSGSTRQIQLNEILIILELFKQYLLLQNNFPPVAS